MPTVLDATSATTEHEGHLWEQDGEYNMDISTTTLATAVQGVRAIASAYDGYEKGRFMKSDEAIRAEIQRRCDMVARHAEKLQGDVHALGFRSARSSLESMIEAVHMLRSEAQFSIISNHVSKHPGVGKLNAKAVRKLVTHDGEVLNALVSTTRAANELAKAMSGLEESEVITLITDWHQQMTRTRNMYLERNMYIDGLTKR